MYETIYVMLKVLFDFALEVWFSIYMCMVVEGKIKDSVKVL